MKNKFTITFTRTEKDPEDGQEYCYEEEIDFLFYSLAEASDYIQNNSGRIWVNHADFPTCALEFDVWVDKSVFGQEHEEDLVGSFTYSQPPKNL